MDPVWSKTGAPSKGLDGRGGPSRWWWWPLAEPPRAGHDRRVTPLGRDTLGAIQAPPQLGAGGDQPPRVPSPSGDTEKTLTCRRGWGRCKRFVPFHSGGAGAAWGAPFPSGSAGSQEPAGCLPDPGSPSRSENTGKPGRLWGLGVTTALGRQQRPGAPRQTAELWTRIPAVGEGGTGRSS